MCFVAVGERMEPGGQFVQVQAEGPSPSSRNVDEWEDDGGSYEEKEPRWSGGRGRGTVEKDGGAKQGDAASRGEP